MMNFENLNFILDFILIAASLWMMAAAIKNLGGLLGKAFNYLVAGVFLMGIAHIAETFLFQFASWSIDIQEFIHRVIVLV
ncbi:hypothetical protein HZB05_01525, partial [Candidatus Wolfebacteria bacterium]|nr:hypothetical protein [Candidatus Wolfebacteria bacterium]